MFGGIFDEIRKEYTGKDKLVVAKPYCSPARNTITGIFNQYGVKLLGFREYPYYITCGKESLPALQIAECIVSSKQVVWAEYLLLRSKRFILWGKAKDSRNLEWARKHNAMPESWNGKPLIEQGCKEGLEVLKTWERARQKGKKK
jgi:hypothetical protein